MERLNADSYECKLASLLNYTLQGNLPLEYIKSMWESFLDNEAHKMISEDSLLAHDRSIVIEELNGSNNCDEILSIIKESLKTAHVSGFAFEKYCENENRSQKPDEVSQNIYNFCGHYKIKGNDFCFYASSDNERVSVYEHATKSPKLGVYISDVQYVKKGDIFGLDNALIIIKDITQHRIIILFKGSFVDNNKKETINLDREESLDNSFFLGRNDQSLIKFIDGRFSRVICTFEKEENSWKINRDQTAKPKIVKYFHNSETLENDISQKVDITDQEFVFEEATFKCILKYRV